MLPIKKKSICSFLICYFQFWQVKHMRSKYGDYFGITVAGYPGSNFTCLIVASSLLFLFYCAISFLANYKNVGIDNIM